MPYLHSLHPDEHTLGGPAPPTTITHACATTHRKRLLHAHMHLHLTFLYADTAQWSQATASLSSLAALIPLLGATPPPTLHVLSTYLTGVIAQGTGVTEAALAAYRSPLLQLPPYSPRGPANVEITTRILAALNTLLILKSCTPSPTLPPTGPLLANLATYFPPSNPTAPASPTPYSQNAHLSAAHSLILSIFASSTSTPQQTQTSPSSPSILATKSLLQRSLALSRQTNNALLLALSLAFIARSFFAGIVGDQAAQAAQAALSTSKAAGSRLWSAVAAGTCVEVAERSGRYEEARKMGDEGARWAGALPEGILKGE